MTGNEEKTLFFDDCVNNRLKLTHEVLAVKGKEYRRNGNPFHNFEVGAALENKTPYEVLHGFFLKHYISYMDILSDLKEGKEIPESHLEEKLGDMINYLIIQEAQIKWNQKI